MATGDGNDWADLGIWGGIQPVRSAMERAMGGWILAGNGELDRADNWGMGDFCDIAGDVRTDGCGGDPERMGDEAAQKEMAMILNFPSLAVLKHKLGIPELHYTDGDMILDFSNIQIANLSAAKRKLEIPSAGAGSGGPSPSVEVSIVAAEDLSAFGPVTAQGKRADSSNPSLTFRKVIGLANATIASGFSGLVTLSGEITNPAWNWTMGDPIFLNGTGLSNTAPSSGFLQQLGTAKGATTIVVDLGEPMLL